MSHALLPVPSPALRQLSGGAGGALDLDARASAGSDNVLGAQSDSQAVSTWLRARAMKSANTLDAYKRESLRLLLWLSEMRLTLEQMQVDDAHRFFAHLAAPPAHWIRPRKPRAGEFLSPTQVLIGPLSAGSINQARTILGTLCDYLQQAGYLRHNVFKLAQAPATTTHAPGHSDKTLMVDSWRWLWHWAQARTDGAVDPRKVKSHNRDRWLLALLYHTGIRRDEAANALMSDFTRIDGGWILRVTGKGRKVREVSVNSILLSELGRWRQMQDLARLPHPDEPPRPLLSSLKGSASSANGLTARAVGLLIEQVARAACRDCEDLFIRANIERMSTHWLRHTSATHRLAAGAALETTQDELGHVDPRTTRIYAKTLARARRDDAERLAAFQQSAES